VTLDLDPLIPQEPPLPPSFRYATVTATDPLRIRLDGDTAPLPITPTSLAAPLVGDRVYVGIVNRRVTVLGIVGGATDPSWSTMTPLNGWNAAGNAPIQVRLVRGFVLIRGEVYGGDGQSQDYPIFNLPARFRPLRRLRVPAGWGTGAGHVGVETNGDVWTTAVRASTPGISLEAIAPFLPAAAG